MSSFDILMGGLFVIALLVAVKSDYIAAAVPPVVLLMVWALCR
ncbi:hypothetical protein OVY01_20910 [Robbsia sp. Bb-Pol-6]|uniref:Uncharacterized protein n=1 Tax=Robbsia betulipollinis TaxID=2981849 RepID=A0ABT3ZSS2_9BURK|nr:hypothetical protein [Robbsia betulipollinis]MCY0389611.1 hypothetical protein [Robbsia betulipollinis]